MPNPIQMTRAQYEAKYGSAPTPKAQPSPASPAPSSGPVTMTRAQYQQKYGTAPSSQPAKAPTANPYSDVPVLGQLSNAGIGIGTSLAKLPLGAVEALLRASSGVAGLTGGNAKGLSDFADKIKGANDEFFQKPFQGSLDTTSGQVGTAVGNVIPYLYGAGEVNAATKGLSAVPRALARTIPDIGIVAAQSGGDAATTGVTGLTSLTANALLPGSGGVVKKGFLPAAGRFAAEVAPGYVSDVAGGLAGLRGEDRTGASAFIPGTGTAISTGLALGVRGVDAAKNFSKRFTPQGVQDSITKEFDDFTTGNKAISKKVDLYENRRNVPVRDMITEPDVYRGLKVENGSVVPDEAIQTLQDRADALLDAKRGSITEVDRLVPAIKKKDILAKAVEDYKVSSLPLADQEDIISQIKKQLAPYPDEMLPSQVDKLRATFRTSARDARGLQKVDNAYSALENATRNAVFDVTESIPGIEGKQFAALNNDIKNHIGTIEFLESLRGSKVKGGRLGTYVGRTIGAIAGSKGGLLGAIAGSEAGGAISRILQNNQLGSSIKMRLIQELTDDPEVIKQARSFLKSIESTTPLLLEAPKPGAPRVQMEGGPTMNIPPRGNVPIGLGDEPQSLGNPNISRQNTANNTIVKNPNIDTAISDLGDNVKSSGKARIGTLLAGAGIAGAGLAANQLLNSGSDTTIKNPRYYDMRTGERRPEPILPKKQSIEVPAFIPPKYHKAVREASKESGLPALLISSLMQVENAKFDPALKNPDATSTALGLTQQTKATRKQIEPLFKKKYGRDYDPKDGNDNILGAALYFNWLGERPGIETDEDKLVAYHLGAGRVDDWKKGVQPFKRDGDAYLRAIKKQAL